MFKVVYKEFDKLMSVCRNSDIVNDNIAVEYIPGQWVKPKIEGSGLFYFNDFYSAKKFVERTFYCSPVQIWKCSIKGKMKLLDKIASHNTVDYWQALNNYRKLKKKLDTHTFCRYDIMETPEDSGMAKMIRLDTLVFNQG